MKQSHFDDQSHIAEQFRIGEEHIVQMAKLAHHKINSFKLSLTNQAYCMKSCDLSNLIRSTLFNYMNPVLVLSHIGFFNDEISN
ncbi:MAG: hypothetical protein QM725_05720 [Lacibacter sp.]